MHTRRLLAFILGAWLSGSLFMTSVATQNLKRVDRLLDQPQNDIARLINVLGRDRTRTLLRYQSLELNRFLFEAWGMTQIFLGGALLAGAVLTQHRSAVLLGGALVMIGFTAYTTYVLVPDMNALSRSFDFLPPDASIAGRERFQAQHIAYAVLEILKMLTAVGLAGRLLLDLHAWRDLRESRASRETQRPTARHSI